MTEAPISHLPHVEQQPFHHNGLNPESIVQPESAFTKLDEVIIVANRKIEPQKAGGLVHAMLAFAQKAEGVQVTSIGWDGHSNRGEHVELEGPQEAFETMNPNGPINVIEIKLSKNQVHAHYEDIANNWLWLTFHDRPELAEGEFNWNNWRSHQRVQRKFAQQTAAYRKAHPDRNAAIWNHDYHMTSVAKYMREEGITDPLGFFLHIPFPTPEIFEYLPKQVREEMLDGLLANDMIGFQTPKDAVHFMANVQKTFNLPPGSMQLSDKGGEIHWQGRTIKIGTYPISIDAEAIKEKVKKPESQTKIEKLKRIFKDKRLMIDVSRLDPSKGILEEIDAYDLFLEQHPELRDDVVFLRIVSPSRENVPAYKKLRDRAREKVDEVNKKWKKHGKKIMYIYKDVKNETVLAMIAASQVALVGTLKDGMNLVAKEAAAAGPENMAIVIGEGAGASEELKRDALICDVRDTEQFAEVIHEALTMEELEVQERKERMEKQVTEDDVEKWSTTFIYDLLVHAQKQKMAA